MRAGCRPHRLKLICAPILVATTIVVYFASNDSAVSDLNVHYKTALKKVLQATRVPAIPSNSPFLDRSGENSRNVQCALTPPGLIGPIQPWMDAPSMEQLETLYAKTVGRGGRGKPADCVSRHKVAVIVPFRAREKQMRIFLHNLHSLLTKQQLDYGIFIVEQIANQTFNRAKLMNVGYVEALKMYPWECFVFHDVDLLPEDDRNVYSCGSQPRHLSVAVDKFNYTLPYPSILGGISALTKEQVEKINGFSNDYWGWGGEDDDLSTRVGLAGYQIARYSAEIARYKMVKHEHEAANQINRCRFILNGKTNWRWMKDGLSNLNYSTLNITEYPLYTRFLVDLLYEEPPTPEIAIEGIPNC